jgi:hypothetical protein
VDGTLSNDIEGYAESLDFLRCYSESVEVSVLLANREGIAIDLANGAVIDEAHRRLLIKADQRLLAAAPALTRRFPDFDFAGSIRALVGDPSPGPTGTPATRPR